MGRKLTEEEINELKIGDHVMIRVVDTLGESWWNEAVVSKIIEPDEEEADDYGIWFHDVYANLIYDEDSDRHFRVREGWVAVKTEE